MNNPNQGEIWLVDMEPQIGSEIAKKRPALIINRDIFSQFAIKIVAPITDWDEHYTGGNNNILYYKLSKNKLNNLSKDSAINCFQIKSFDLVRFHKKIGEVTKEELKNVTVRTAAIIKS